MRQASEFEKKRFGTFRLPWRRPTDPKPTDRQLCLIVVNDMLVCDIFVYFAETDKFMCGNEVAYSFCDFGNAQAWLPKVDIPLPHWLEVQILQREAEGAKSVAMAADYRKDKADLFGKVVDPDDEADGRV